MNTINNELNGYRAVLYNELRRRQAVNPQYSLRAFAGLIGMSPGFLSSVLSGHKSLSLKKAQVAAKALGHGPGQIAEFCRLVMTESKDPNEQLEAKVKPAVISLDQFQLIADWYYLAILDLTTTKDFQSDAIWIAKRLNLTKEITEEAIQRLIRSGLLAQDTNGTLTKTQKHISTLTEIPSRALRLHHGQMIQKAIAAMEERPISEREISGMTVSLDPKLLPEAKALMHEFKEKMAVLISRGAPEKVYQLNLQFFELTHELSKEIL